MNSRRRTSNALLASATILFGAWAYDMPASEPIPFELETEVLEIEFVYEPLPIYHGLPDHPAEYVHEIDSREPLIQAIKHHAQWEELRCLALNVYHEARGSTWYDQVATANVVMNRIEDARYPYSVCEVVYDDRQFSWTHDNITDYPHELEAWEFAQIIAFQVFTGAMYDNTDGSTHYHTTTIRPHWSRTASNHQVIGAHVYMVAR